MIDLLIGLGVNVKTGFCIGLSFAFAEYTYYFYVFIHAGNCSNHV